MGKRRICHAIFRSGGLARWTQVGNFFQEITPQNQYSRESIGTKYTVRPSGVPPLPFVLAAGGFREVPVKPVFGETDARLAPHLVFGLPLLKSTGSTARGTRNANRKE